MRLWTYNIESCMEYMIKAAVLQKKSLNFAAAHVQICFRKWE